MKQLDTKTTKFFTLVLLIVTFFVGALLAKVVPMQSGHGFSSLVHSEAQKTKKTAIEPKSKTKTAKNTATAMKETKPETKKETYVEQVNQEITQNKFANRLPIQLLLQTDEKWKNTAYGSGNSQGNTLEINGCAILSLTMVASYLDNKTYVPQHVLDWSKNDYYLDGQGTAWSIFYEFAKKNGYQYEDLGADINAVKKQLTQKHPVLISVKPGYFTNTGHIMVLTGLDNGKFWLNDPNDSEAKGHSKKAFTEEEISKEALNYWTIYK